MGVTRTFKTRELIGWGVASFLMLLIACVAVFNESPWVAAYLKPAGEKRESLVKDSSFSSASDLSELLGVATATLVLADGAITKEESAFVSKLIDHKTDLAKGQGEFDISDEMLDRISADAWRRTYQTCIEAFIVLRGGDRQPPFNSSDYFQLQDLLHARTLKGENAQADAQVLLAFSRLWQSFASGKVGVNSVESSQEYERAAIIFRKLRKQTAKLETSAPLNSAVKTAN